MTGQLHEFIGMHVAMLLTGITRCAQTMILSDPHISVPGGPEAPAIGKVTHHSVELSWNPPDHASSTGKLCYCVQEEEAGKGRGFVDVYK